MAMGLVPLNDTGLAIVKEVEGERFNAIIARQHFMQVARENGEVDIYIKKAGLQNKMEGKYRDRWSISTEIPSTEEVNRLKEMMDFKSGVFVAMKATITIDRADGKPATFSAIGTASPANCKNGRYIEMAETRAKNRAMRDATNCGFTSVEEMDERMDPEELKAKTAGAARPDPEEAKAAKDAFYAKWRESGRKPEKGEVIKYVMENIGKDPARQTLTRDDYIVLLRRIDEDMAAERGEVIDAEVIPAPTLTVEDVEALEETKK